MVAAATDALAHAACALQALTRRAIQPPAPRGAGNRPAAPADRGADRLVSRRQRLPDLPQRDKKLAAAEQELRNRLSYAGSRLVFTTERATTGGG
jgi:hypothetical protein